VTTATSDAPGAVVGGLYGRDMSSMSPAAGDADLPASAAPPDTRARIAAAAFELFAAQGYDNTTVDAIAERAGIARRTFFRYFRSKDDVIFPDHDTLLAEVRRYLSAIGDVPPVDAVCGGVRLVFRGYVTDAAVSVQRYRLTRSVVPLRDREIASVRRYERAFSKYLHGRYAESMGEGAAAALRADVIAAAVVAAHNAVLRDWLRAGGTTDPFPALEDAFTWVAQTFAQGPTPPRARSAGEAAPPAAADPEQGDDDVVVAVFRAGQPIDDVVQRITRSL
jgi:AcrR family transcriptional regulator